MNEGDSLFPDQSAREQRQQTTKEILIAELGRVLEYFNPSRFDARWLEANEPTIVWRLQSNNGGRLTKKDWQRLISNLDQKWQDRWGMIRRDARVDQELAMRKLVPLKRRKARLE